MKKVIILLAAALMAGSAAFAQSKGDMYVGGGLTLGAGSTNYSEGAYSVKGTNPTTFTIAPSFGYFVLDNLRVGAGLSLGITGQSTGEGDSKVRNNRTTFLVGPQVAYYLRLSDKLYYTPELGIYGGAVTETYKAGSVKVSQSGGAFKLGLSLAQVEFRATDKLAFAVDVMNLSYMNLSTKVDDVNEDGEPIKTKVSEGTFNFDINATLAVRYYF